MHYGHLLTLYLYFRGPEDESEGVETCRLKITFYVIKTVVFDWFFVLYTIYTINCILYTLYTIHCILLYYILYTLYTIYYTLHTLYTTYYTLYTL